MITHATDTMTRATRPERSKVRCFPLGTVVGSGTRLVVDVSMSDMATERDADGRVSARALATGYGLAVLSSPIVTLDDDPSGRQVLTTVMAVVIAALLALLFGGWVSTRRTMWLGPALVAAAALLYDVTSAGVATAVIALVLGAGVGLAVGPLPERGLWVRVAAGLAAGLVTVGIAWVVADSPTTPLVISVLVVAAACAARVILPGSQPTGSASGASTRRILLGTALGGAVALLAWTGANDPQLSWFGPVAAHGPREAGQVALTFDDGPNDPYTLEIADELTRRGVRGSFFEVGKAVEEHPEITQALVRDGHLVGNHSFHHDYWRWLDPLYPELDATQGALSSAIGECPRFFRPPHGQRTPLMAVQVARRDMVTVTWDVSAADWITDDGELVAKRVLNRVRPGSIVLLHDGLDGIAGEDRSVVADALPLILDGLEERGLEPVRLDEMLGGPAYLRDCP